MHSNMRVTGLALILVFVPSLTMADQDAERRAVVALKAGGASVEQGTR